MRMGNASAAADELHKLQPVAGLQRDSPMLALRHDFEIALDCDAARVAAKRGDQFSEGDRIANLARNTIEKNLHTDLHCEGLPCRTIAATPKGAMTKPIYVLGGPNLNLLGTREPDIYGTETLDDLESRVRAHPAGHNCVFRQTNSEGTLVDWVQEAGRDGAALVLNAAAYTHTSIALHDALKALAIPVVEVHLSNPAAREAFRHTNYVSPLASATIAGLGPQGYVLAMDAAHHLVNLGGKTSQ